MRILMYIAVAGLLAACSTTTPAERLALNQKTCSSYGFRPNTDAYSTCMMQLDLAAQEADAARRARIGAALSSIGEDTQPRRPITCNTFGSSRNTGYGTFGNATTTCR